LVRQRCDQTVVLWSYRSQRGIALRLDELRRNLQERVCSLESSLSSKTEDFTESLRQWQEERHELTKDRDKFKKLYTKMVKAHEQAMEDLKTCEGSIENQAKMILTLSSEKSRLTNMVEDLEDDKKRLSKQLADARDEIARMREMLRGFRQSMRETEVVLWQIRKEVERLEAIPPVLEQRLDDAAAVEARLRDDLLVTQAAVAAAKSKLPPLVQKVAREHEITLMLIGERDELLAKMRTFEEQLLRVIRAWRLEVTAVREKAERDLEEFKTVELTRVQEEFRKQTEAIIRRNDILEREVAVADTLAPHLSTLNPVGVDESRICASCRKVFVFEGTLSM